MTYSLSFVIHVVMFPGNNDGKVQVNDEKNKLLFELKTKQVHTLTVANKSLVFVYTAHIIVHTLLPYYSTIIGVYWCYLYISPYYRS